jgi:hypothetical protein
VRGPWTDESSSTWIDRSFRPSPKDDRALLHDVRHNIGNCEIAGDDFPVDGKRAVFSTLRPEPGGEGALHLAAAHRNVVNAVVFLLVAMAGLSLTPRPVGTRLWWLAGLVVTIVLLAVFTPTLAQTLLDWPLYLALGLVLMAWAVRWLAWFVPGLVTWLSAAFQRAAAASAMAAAAAASAADVPPPLPRDRMGETPFAPVLPPVPPAGDDDKEGGASHG